jgi:hypothetical protein
MECMSATLLLCWILDKKEEDMNGCLYRVGSDCTIHAFVRYYIARVKPLEGVALNKYNEGRRNPNDRSPAKSKWRGATSRNANK